MGGIMRDLIESLTALLKVHLGIEPDPTIVNYAIVLGALALPLLWGYRWVLRQFGNMRALSSELEAVTRVILDDTKPQFERLLVDVAVMQHELEAKLAHRLDALTIDIRSINSVDGQPDDQEVGAEDPAIATGRRPRLAMAGSVRDTALDRWMKGRDFKRHPDDPSICYYYGRAPGDESPYIYIVLQTPYRYAYGVDGRLPFTLDIWVNRRKHLNFEWDVEGNYALRGFKRGDWIEDVATWNMRPVAIEEEQRKQA